MSIPIDQRKYSKYQAFHYLLSQLSSYYLEADEAGQQLLETTVGAGLFYLPSKKKLHYSGMISPESLESGKQTQEHMYPRKIAALELLNTVPETVDLLIQQCDDKYLRYHIVTPSQNKQLCPFQKVGTFISPEHSYELAGIELINDPRL